MIQIHTVESIEAAIQLQCLIPEDAKPKSRHRFWIGDHRVDAYLNPAKVLFIHWLHRATGIWEHPRKGGMVQARMYRKNWGAERDANIYYYPGQGWTATFKPAPDPVIDL